jgi:hypothetical protein
MRYASVSSVRVVYHDLTHVEAQAGLMLRLCNLAT